jgi:ankyrin repeat protein
MPHTPLTPIFKQRLLTAILDNNEETASLFFDHGMDVNMQFTQNKAHKDKTPIHFAAEHGSLSVLLAIISRGAGIDPSDAEQRTPLQLAIENNRYACVRSLIELGSAIEQKDKYGRTPLLYACKLGSQPIVELLLSYGADVNAQN